MAIDFVATANEEGFFRPDGRMAIAHLSHVSDPRTLSRWWFQEVF